MFGKKTISFFAAAMLLVSLTACDLFGGKSGGDSVTAPVASYVDAINNADADKLIKLYPDEVAKAYESNKAAYNKLQEELESDKEDSEGKITYKINEKEAIVEDDLSDLESEVNSALEYVADAADIAHEDITITEAYAVNAKLTYGGEEIDTTFKVFKSDGKWYLYDGLYSMVHYF